MSRLWLVALHVTALLLRSSLADVYINNPRGSNNKLNEGNNNANNQQRLFDSQNNAEGGYQVGDNCVPHCHKSNDDRTYDPTKPGAGKGTMIYYTGSELYVEWLAQHGCGVDHPNLHCQMILQYMCDTDNVAISDGKETGNANTQNANTGVHESDDYYTACQTRSRNKGLYIADQNVQDNKGATKTRQDAAGTRYGRECPEERDYYPYWHPTPWHDIAVLTSEPHIRCDYYRRESQNVIDKGTCFVKSVNNQPRQPSPHNNEADCKLANHEWELLGKHDEPAPECLGGIQSRDNHNGNARNGQPMYYTWKIPSHILKDDAEEAQCVLRLRYNISTGDFHKGATVNSKTPNWGQRDVGEDYFHVDATYNGQVGGAGRRRFSTRPIIPGNPIGDLLGFSRYKVPQDNNDYYLQLQVNTDQYGRTFQDRTHIFKVRKRPDDVSDSARIINYNVRGRRGNINQVYPSVEYDFVPTELTVEQGTYLHIQWTGSDNNNQNNAGNGRQRTDRSNIVQLSDRRGNVPVPLEEHTLFADMPSLSADPESKSFLKGVEAVKKFAFLNQELGTCFRYADLQNNGDDPGDNDETNCMQLNGASAYFDGGLVKMERTGEFHIACTRNNDFSNRSHKATIKVTGASLGMAAAVGMAIGGLSLLTCLGYGFAALYALHKPGSWLFSKRYRPRVLSYLPKERISAKEAERREIFREEREQLKKAAEMEMVGMAGPREPRGGDASSSAGSEPEGERSKPAAAAATSSSWRQRFCCCIRSDAEMGTIIYVMLNIIVFGIGFWSHWDGGFQGHIAFPLAKGAGFSLDLNYAMLILPTLKSLQTALRGRSGTSNLRLMDDPIAFHIMVGSLIFLGSVVHIAAHIVHMVEIAKAPTRQDFELGMMELTEEEKKSGTPIISQIFAPPRFVAVSGIIITLLMMLLGMTAVSCVRRGSNAITRTLGGYRVFYFFHSAWPLIYILLLIHAPARLWIWFFFPLLFVLVDKVLQNQNQITFAVLKNANLLPYDVLNLNFDLPDGFTYQPGQYVLLGWRGEWHPFTLTSAPEERQLSLHIRSPETLDWCSALKRHLCYEVPCAAGIKSVNFPPTPGTNIKYTKVLDLQSGKVYSRPDTGVSGKRIIGDEDMEGGSFHEDNTPEDAVVLQLQGPFGAPAQRCWEYETIMVVGSGIGVTPFISIVRSVQERTRLRQLMGDNSVGKRSHSRRSVKGTGDMKTREEIAADIIPVPFKIYFVWIVRNQNEANWFYDVLVNSIKGPSKDIVEIQIYVTGEQELTNVKRLECAERQFCGRPNWARVFKEVKGKHPTEHVGVFLCGSPEIGKQLAIQSQAFTDPPHVGGCKFSFHKENF